MKRVETPKGAPESKKKVLFLLEAFDKGGIEKVTLDIVNNLDPQRYDVTVQTFWYGGYCQSLVHDNVNVIPFFFKRYVRGIMRLIEVLSPGMLYKLFVRGNYDVEIAASDGGAAKVISGSTNCRSKKICWVHMDVMLRGSQLREFQNAKSAKVIYSKFDQIVCVSEACKAKFSEKFGDYGIDVVYNPLPDAEIRKMAELECPISFPAGTINFLCVGRLVKQKGFDRLLNVCRRLQSAGFHDYTVSILGDGNDRVQLEQMISSYEVDENVFLLGYTDNPYCYMKNASAFLLPSRDEAFPLVVGESLIVGTPVLATDCCGIQEWLCDSEYGLVMDNSEDGIFNGMKTVLEHPELLDVYRKRIPERVEKVGFSAALENFEQLLR